MKFIRNLTITILLNVLFFFLWLMILRYNNLIEESYFDDSIQTMLRNLLIGTIIGIITGFLQLLPLYIKKQWNLHIVVPRGLLIHLFVIIFSLMIMFMIHVEFLKLFSLNLGISLGGLIAIIAYIGEVEKEHKDDPKLIENTN